MPLAYWTMAPGAGQAMRQPGSAQCMHWSLRISQCSRSVGLVLVEPDQVPEVRRHVGQRLIRARLARRLRRQIVPLLARHLARLAADAGRGVDQLGDRRLDLHARRRRRRRGDRRIRAWRHQTSQGKSAVMPSHQKRGTLEWDQIRGLDLDVSHAFSSFTRKPLYSGANEFGSTMVGVTRLASDPRCSPRPRKPQ